MVVMGIDPGYGRTGYGILDYSGNKYKVIEYGSITTQAGESFPKRLYKIAEELELLLSKYNVEAVSIEKLFFNTNTKTAIDVAQARGVMLYILEKNNVAIYEYTPLQIKQALVGYGRADKIQIMNMVKGYLNLQDMPKLDDTTDALAMAICHCNCSGSLDIEKRIRRKM